MDTLYLISKLEMQILQLVFIFNIFTPNLLFFIQMQKQTGISTMCIYLQVRDIALLINF